MTASPERRDSKDKGRSDGLSSAQGHLECFCERERRNPGGVVTQDSAALGSFELASSGFSIVPSGTTRGVSFLPFDHVLDGLEDNLPNLPFQVFLGRL